MWAIVQPRPTKGAELGIRVINKTLDVKGKLAMFKMACATSELASFVSVRCCVSSVSVVPKSIWLQTMSKSLPSTAMLLVSPVTACLAMV